jgi:hypothetical protein
MGIFDFLRPTRIPRLPGGKHVEQLTVDEVVPWLQKQPRWRPLGIQALTAVATRLQGEPFAILWGVCEWTRLDLSAWPSEGIDLDIVLSGFAGLLHQKGSAIAESCHQRVIEQGRQAEAINVACMCYMSAARLYPDGLHHYGALAALRSLSGGKYEPVRDFVVAACYRPLRAGGPTTESVRQVLREAAAAADAAPTDTRLITLAESLSRNVGYTGRPVSEVDKEQSDVAEFISQASFGLAHDNFEYFAVHAATFWAILTDSYSDRFGSEREKLAVCAYLVLQRYVEQGLVGAQDLRMAVYCASDGTCGTVFANRAHERQTAVMRLFGSDPSVPTMYEPRKLLNLTMQLEVLAFCADNSEMLPVGEVVDTVIDKKAAIARALSNTEEAIRENRLPVVEAIRRSVADVLASPRFASTISEMSRPETPRT